MRSCSSLFWWMDEHLFTLAITRESLSASALALTSACSYSRLTSCSSVSRSSWFLFSSMSARCCSSIASWLKLFGARLAGSKLLTTSTGAFTLMVSSSLRSLQISALSTSIEPELSSLIEAWFLMSFARCANLRVERVSEKFIEAGEMFAIIVVLELPPSESLSRKVSLESR